MFIKLTYFDLRGRAEVIRYLLKYGGIEFQDIRITAEDWVKLKSTVPFGQLPIYEEHGKVSNQTVAIARYLAKKLKLAGNNNWEDLELDALVDTTSDLLQTYLGRFLFTTTIDAVDAMTGMDLLKNYPHLQSVVSNVTDLAVIREWRENDKSSIVLVNDA